MAAGRRQHARARAGGGIRIIGGQWRGRRLAVADRPGLRPTADRVRETLFNWLQAVVPGARCLDLFAGSGALGLEALSRGAGAVTFVDSDRQAMDRLCAVLDSLDARDRADCRCERAERFLSHGSGPFDVVFLDPPFAGDALARASASLTPLCHSDSLVYVETDQRDPAALLPDSWTCHRNGRSGGVQFGLYRPFVAPG
ncbi:16S rRNA (guanine(966)-N(2))-methyltransferase RsmD [Pseudohaliea rubra]|uniref:16S rRNA (guanine(966)-N(2))-methyltransferase RsmD n=1 Tax=Pseudohaliea rubra TaxID=475795 RepID=UPI00068CF1CE|nr:16S rRNA (guanine(966)-N(2))-methyltransferase RsmD [Pseudohaliea rubra]